MEEIKELFRLPDVVDTQRTDCLKSVSGVRLSAVSRTCRNNLISASSLSNAAHRVHQTPSGVVWTVERVVGKQQQQQDMGFVKEL